MPSNLISTDRWRQAQAGETAFWQGHADLILSDSYRSRLKGRAQRLAQWLAPHDTGNHRAALELGGGGTQLLDFFPIPLRLAADPLAGFYAKVFGGVLSRSVSLLGTRGEELPFRANSFDLIFCRNVLDHVESPARVVDELVRVLAPGGLLYSAVNTFSGPLLYYRRLHPATEEPHPFSTRTFERLFTRPDLVRVSGRIDDPEEMEHYHDAIGKQSLRTFLRERLVGCACLHFVELLLQKWPAKTVTSPAVP